MTNDFLSFAQALKSRTRLMAAGLFITSALTSALLVSACDSNSPAPAPTTVAAPTGVERGKVVYARYCNTCHPGGGRGAGPDILGPAQTAGDGQLKTIVRNGKNRMPPFGESTISDEDLDSLVAYMRTLQAQQ